MAFFNNDIMSIYQELMDEALVSFSKEALLVYPSKMTDCADCIYDSIGQKSSNRYKDGGPIPFSHGPCPMCQGAGKTPIAVTATIDVTVDYGLTNLRFKESFDKLPSNIKAGFGYIGIRGWKTDMAKTNMADYLIIDGYKYRRVNLPIDVFSIVQNRYFYLVLEKIQ